ncbi:hypothetical protein [Flexithrix dorotheae]|uniref:hypothetical protein n=1 Tax=Flexithrix dorotheae TaxID=70993 RepID=UPI000363B19E|nr:hypothetical protein [Flexithrix dorotheae]
MKRVKFLLLSLVAGSLWFLSSCGGDDPDDPQPTSVKFTVTSATKDGAAIDASSYTITFNFDAEGNPNGYTATGSSNLTPTTANSGTFSVASGIITFSAGGTSRSVNGTVSASTKSLTLDYTLTKIDDGVSADDAGDYRYEMAAQ